MGGTAFNVRDMHQKLGSYVDDVPIQPWPGLSQQKHEYSMHRLGHIIHSAAELQLLYRALMLFLQLKSQVDNIARSYVTTKNTYLISSNINDSMPKECCKGGNSFSKYHWKSVISQ